MFSSLLLPFPREMTTCCLRERLPKHPPLQPPGTSPPSYHPEGSLVLAVHPPLLSPGLIVFSVGGGMGVDNVICGNLALKEQATHENQVIKHKTGQLSGTGLDPFGYLQLVIIIPSFQLPVNVVGVNNSLSFATRPIIASLL